MASTFILTTKYLLGAVILLPLLAAYKPRVKAFALAMALGGGGGLVFAVLRKTTAIKAGMVNTAVLCAALLASAALAAAFAVVHAAALAAAPVAAPAAAPAADPASATTAAPAAAPAAAPFKQGAKARRARDWCIYAFSALTTFYASESVFLMTADFSLPGEPLFTTDALRAGTGWLAGLLLAAFVFAAVFRVSAKAREDASLRKVFAAASFFALAVNAVQNAALTTQFLIARRIIKPGRALFRVVTVFVNNEIGFTLVLSGVSFCLALGVCYTLCTTKETAFTNPAQRRLHTASVRRAFRWAAGAALSVGVGVFALTGLAAWASREVTLSPAEPLTLTEENALVPVSRIEDGRLHRFAWSASDGTEVRFIVIKKSESSYGVGLDACDICGNTGYYERKDGVVCRLCDVVMNKSTIGFKGGCNPVPLAYTMRDGNMVISLSSLEKEKGRFK